MHIQNIISLFANCEEKKKKPNRENNDSLGNLFTHYLQKIATIVPTNEQYKTEKLEHQNDLEEFLTVIALL